MRATEVVLTDRHPGVLGSECSRCLSGALVVHSPVLTLSCPQAPGLVWSGTGHCGQPVWIAEHRGDLMVQQCSQECAHAHGAPCDVHCTSTDGYEEPELLVHCQTRQPPHRLVTTLAVQVPTSQKITNTTNPDRHTSQKP